VKLLRTIRLDPSDTFVFEKAAEPGEWAVSGAFVFWSSDPATLEGKARSAFRGGFLGVGSLGWSTLVQIVEASDDDRLTVIDTLAKHLVAHFGAPTAAAAVADADRNRQDYLRRFHDVDRELPTHYDVVVNTDVLAAEQAARSSGVPFTIFRCTMFMETLPKFVRDGKAMVMGRQPHPWRWLAADDYAAMVARAYELPEAAGKVLGIECDILIPAALERAVTEANASVIRAAVVACVSPRNNRQARRCACVPGARAARRSWTRTAGSRSRAWPRGAGRCAWRPPTTSR